MSFPLLFLPSFLLAVFFTLSDCLVIFYIYFQLERLLYFSAFFNIHIFAIYLNRNIYVHTFENKHISYLFIFSIARALMLRFTIAKHLEQLFFLERSLLWD